MSSYVSISMYSHTSRPMYVRGRMSTYIQSSGHIRIYTRRNTRPCICESTRMYMHTSRHMYVYNSVSLCWWQHAAESDSTGPQTSSEKGQLTPHVQKTWGPQLCTFPSSRKGLLPGVTLRTPKHPSETRAPKQISSLRFIVPAELHKRHAG